MKSLVTPINNKDLCDAAAVSDAYKAAYDMINDRTFTRADEIAALKKIRAILEFLPEDSYVKAAFEGCVDLAEVNIRNDFLLSFPARIEYLENQLYERSVR